MDKSKIEAVKEAATKLLKFFSESQTETFESVKVVDSDDVIEYGSLEVGADVSISTSSGSQPAPDGEYNLVNGSVITVSDGKISEIESEGDEAKEDAVDSDDEQLADTPAAPAAKPKDAPSDKPALADNSDLANRVSKLEDLVKELTKSAPSKDQLNAFESDLKELNQSISDLAKIPTQFSNDNRVEVKEDEMDKYRKIAEKYSNKK